MPCESLFFSPCLNIPQTDGLILTATCYCLPIRAETHAKDQPRMPCEYLFFSPCLNIPEPDGVIITTTCYCLPIRAETHAIDTICVSYEFLFFSPCLNIPQTDSLIPIATCYCLPIRAETHAIDTKRSCFGEACHCTFRQIQFRYVWGNAERSFMRYSSESERAIMSSRC